MNIFELSSQYQSLMQKVMDNDEISDELMQSLESVNDSLENKILNYTSIVKSINAKAKSIEDAISAMNKRRESLIKSAERLENTIKETMKLSDKEKIENAYHVVKLMVNNPKVEYSDRDKIPKEYWRHKIKETIEPDTLLISKSLKDGIEVPGAYLVRNVRLSIQ